MYKTVLYGLLVLSGIAVIFGFTGLLPYSGFHMLSSLVVLFLVCFVANSAFARMFKVAANAESYAITALILFLILLPVSSWESAQTIAAIGFIAMASKYILAIGKKHVFNPAAIALVIAGAMGVGSAFWWVGSEAMLIPVLIVGFLILRKVQRFQMFLTFVFVALISVSITNYTFGIFSLESIVLTFVSAPIIFFGSIMLTEPLTTPPQKKLQILYAIIVGGLFGAQFSIGSAYSSPELALVLGNILSFILTPRARLVLSLKEKKDLEGGVKEFVWKGDKKLDFKPGQYLEWTLGHKSPDSRGNRRYFTIASSPTESDLKLGVKFYDNPSSFKKSMVEMQEGDGIIASQLSGNFTMPEDMGKKLVFIAGGIGVTPFRSMVKYLHDRKEKRDIVLLYSNRTPADIAYRDLFAEAEGSIGLRTIHVVNDLAGKTEEKDLKSGFITADMIMKEIPDYKDRMYYISGPHGMVSAFEGSLRTLGVPKHMIKIDFFPGFA